MAFEIKNTPVLDFEEIAIKNVLNQSSIKILTKGGILNSWRFPYDNSYMELIDGNVFEKSWEGFENNGFKGGKMSPFSCRLKNGKYTLNDTAYCIEKHYLGNHAIHGIIYDAMYQVKAIDNNEKNVKVTLQYQYLGSDKGYPFPFTIFIAYSFSIDGTITISTKIQNDCNQSIPIMDGWHPYFKLDTKVDTLEIKFQNQGKVEYDNELIPTGSFIQDNTFEHGKIIGNRHLDDCFSLIANTTLTLSSNHFIIEMLPLENYPYVQLYTPDHRQSIAIENLSGIPNCFNNKIGLQFLKPNEKIEFSTQFKAYNKF